MLRSELLRRVAKTGDGGRRDSPRRHPDLGVGAGSGHEAVIGSGFRVAEAFSLQFSRGRLWYRTERTDLGVLAGGAGVRRYGRAQTANTIRPYGRPKGGFGIIPELLL